MLQNLVSQLKCSETMLGVISLLLCSYRIKFKSVVTIVFLIEIAKRILMLCLMTENCCLQNGHVFQAVRVHTG